MNANGLERDMAENVLREWMQFGTPSQSQPVRSEELSDDLFDESLALAIRQGALGLAGQAVLLGFPATPAQRERLDSRLAGAMGWVLRLERSLVAAVREIEAIGIDHRVQKGLAVAHVVYGAWPAMRVSSDIDLLVRPEDFERAIEVFEAAGAKRKVRRELRTGYDLRFSKSADLTDSFGMPLDLHRRISFDFFGHSIDLDEFFERPVPFYLGGQRLLSPNREALFLNACLRATVGPSYQLSTLRDIAELAFNDQFSADQMRRYTTSWRLEAPVDEALRRTEVWIPGVRERLGAAGGLRVRSRDVNRLSALSIEGKPMARMMQKAAAQPSWRERAAFLANYLLPDERYRESSGGWRSYGELGWSRIVTFAQRSWRDLRSRRT